MEKKSNTNQRSRALAIAGVIILVIGLLLFRFLAPEAFNNLFGELFSKNEITGQSAQTSAVTTGEGSAEVPAESRTDLTEAEELARYIHAYGHLPSNFITKDEARALGWSGGGLDKYKKGACIGGDVFKNSEGLLPAKEGRKYYECDVGTLGASERGARRLVYSNDGMIFYTSDHYEHYTRLY